MIESTSMKPADFSDAGNAAVFVREYREDLIFTDSMGWLCWDGKRWERNEHKALELAEEFSMKMLEEARELNREAAHSLADLTADKAEGEKDREALEQAKGEQKSAQAYLQHAMITRRAARIRAILDLARPYMVIPGNMMDADPWDLNTQAGIYNIVTGDWRLNERAAYCTKITSVAKSEQGTELWDQFLDTITCGDNSLKGFLQMVIGMALFGKVYHEGVTFAVGDGKNGKSTFFNAVGKVLGDYTGYINIDVITTRGANDKAALSTLRGKRLVIAGELEEGRRLSSATIKKIASTDPFQVEEKYKQPETVVPSHTLCLFTNHLPHVSATDDGTWRRIIVIPFNATIPKSEAIQNYADYLVENAGGAILAWAIEGAQNFARNKFHLTIPDAVAEITEAYRSRENWLTNFINDRCVIEKGVRIGARELYTAYRNWAEETGEYVRSEKDFSAEMEKVGFRQAKPGNKRVYQGVCLAEYCTFSR